MDELILKNLQHHLSIKTTSPAAEARDFYENTMKLKYVREVQIGDDCLLYFSMADSLLLEVIITIGADAPESITEAGFVHFAFTVNEIAPWLKLVGDEGLEITYGPTVIPELEINTFLFKDPFGAVWEIMEDTK